MIMIYMSASSTRYPVNSLLHPEICSIIENESHFLAIRVGIVKRRCHHPNKVLMEGRLHTCYCMFGIQCDRNGVKLSLSEQEKGINMSSAGHLDSSVMACKR